MSDRSFCHSLQKSKRAIALFVALFKRVTKRVIALSKRAKEQK